MQRGTNRQPLIRTLATTVLSLGLACAGVHAQGGPSFSRPLQGTGSVEAAPDALKGITVDEHRGDSIPLDLTFEDDRGQAVDLRKYFNGKKPVVLQLGYYDCPMLCSLVSQGSIDSLKQLTLDAGKDYEYLFVSINPAEKAGDASEKKQTFLAKYDRPGAESGVHFLVGNQGQIQHLAQAVGFNYKWVESAQQYSHPAVVVLLTPEGKISRYLYGVKFDPQTVRLSLVEASDGKVGSAMDQVLLTCFMYDGQQGKYALAAMGVMRIGGALTVLALVAVLIRAFRQEHTRNAAAVAAGDSTGQQQQQDH